MARSTRRGVWRLPNGGERPWDYRKQNQSWCTPTMGIHQGYWERSQQRGVWRLSRGDKRMLNYPQPKR
jgi:hypothetical protein